MKTFLLKKSTDKNKLQRQMEKKDLLRESDLKSAIRKEKLKLFFRSFLTLSLFFSGKRPSVILFLNGT